MAFKRLDRARVTTATTGTGTMTLGSAVGTLAAGYYQTFGAGGLSTGDTVRYGIEDGTNWEVGVGTYNSTGPTLTRDTVEASSAGGTTKINLSGSAEVYATISANDFAYAGRQAIWVPAAAAIPNTTNGPVAGSVETTTNKVMLSTYDFDPSTIQSLMFAVRMPKQWDGGSFTYEIVWTHGATTTNFKAAFEVDAVAVSDGDSADAAFGTAVQVNDTGGTTNTMYVSPESSAVTAAGSPASEDVMFVRVRRVATDGTNDTLAIAASFLGITLYINTTTGNDA